MSFAPWSIRRKSAIASCQYRPPSCLGAKTESKRTFIYFDYSP